MRLHRNLTYAVIDSLRDVFNEGVYADKAALWFKLFFAQREENQK